MEDQSKKDITDKWLDVVHQHLLTLEELEITAKQGCANIIEYINIPSMQVQQLPVIQLKNMDFWIDEFGMTFKDINAVVKKETLEAMKGKLKVIQIIRNLGFKDKEGKRERIYKTITNTKEKTKKLVLNEGFEILLGMLSNLRGELVDSLKHILWMPDSTDKKREEA